jgi:hypothetical protein
MAKRKKKKKLSKKAKKARVARTRVTKTGVKKTEPAERRTTSSKKDSSMWLPVKQIKQDIWFNAIFMVLAAAALVALKIWNPFGF